MPGSTPPPSGPRTHSTRLDVVAQALAALMKSLEAVDDRAARRALLARLHVCMEAVERWMVSAEHSEVERAATFREVLELHVDVIAAARRPSTPP